jgi:hypothetical protein
MKKEYSFCLDNECSIVSSVSHEALEEFMNRLAWI